MIQWKKGLACALSAALLSGAAIPALAEQTPTVIIDTESGETAEQLMNDADVPAWASEDEAVPVEGEAIDLPGTKSAVLMEMNNGSVLFEMNSHEKVPIASVTKVMTLLLIMEAIDDGTISYQDMVTCSAFAASMGGSQIWLEEGETMSVDDMLKAICVVSANDCCAAMAEYLSGSMESFVARMNQRAAELGMNDTHFVDCSGLSDDGYSSAHDVALMSRELMKHDGIVKYTTIWMDTLRNGASQLVNTNKLVRFYKGVTGLKTGTTSTAGHNLSATAERDGLKLVAVVLGCETTDQRFGGARKLLDYGFANYSVYTPQIDPEQLVPVKVLSGTEPSVRVVADTPESLLVKKGQEKNVTSTVEMSEDLEAPVYTGQVVGRIVLTLDGQEVASYSIRAECDVPKMSTGKAFVRLLKALLA
ncbi:MAG: D-alanyl-D-alanine carboxypeptidase [Clostridiales bacterium]|nr:D-alanyl-D-alanine carboxypeptidase [Clostridiales bacterium]